MASAYLYGTLMHLNILKRVLGNDASHLQICPAILTDYTRHKVKFADYPAILPCARSKTLLGRDLTPEENSVRGTIVAGLTARDIALLDIFEGDQYVRSFVTAHPLGPFAPVPADAKATSDAVGNHLIPATLLPLESTGELAQPIPALTYVWYLGDGLEKELWSFDEFVKKNAWKWTGESARRDDYDEVDVVRERLNGEFVPREA